MSHTIYITATNFKILFYNLLKCHILISTPSYTLASLLLFYLESIHLCIFKLSVLYYHTQEGGPIQQ